MQNIVIVGGGTAGWISALYIKRFWNELDVTVIESSKIGILGAGEGSTQLFAELLKELDIDEIDFINKTKATIKIGIEFEGWRGDKSKYTNYFLDDWVLNSNTQLYDLNYYTQVKGAYGYHFDARLVANYFKNIAESRGIKYIDAIVNNVNLNDSNDIVSLSLDTNTTFNTDFVFDCTGFKRNIIGEVYKSEWVSYKEFLKVNTAVPFFLPREDTNMVMNTNAVAMKYGWMWQIPLQDRWGCGYIFDSQYINEEEAHKEIEDYLGHTITSPRTIEFQAGSFKKVWINNCIAIGLSSGFLEPLEATSIMTSILQLNMLKLYWETNNRESYNNDVESLNMENMSFIYYHYMCDRNDTEFWKGYKNRKAHPTLLNAVLDKDKNFIVDNDDELKKLFPISLYNIHTWKGINYGANNVKKGIL